MFLHTLLALSIVTSAAHRSASTDSTEGKARATPASTASAARRHTTFGIAIAPVSDAVRSMPYLEADEGVMIAQVQARSAAEAGGLHAGDLVLKINGKRVDETTIFAVVKSSPRNEAFRVEYLRNGGWHEAWVKIDQ